MEKQFCTYKISKELRELGFDEPCLGVWNESKDEYIVTLVYSGILHEGYTNDLESFKVCSPLWQQAIDWLREEHKLFIEPRVYLKEDGTNSYVGWVVGDDFDTEEPVYLDSYYLSRESAIKEAIEIVKTKINGKSN